VHELADTQLDLRDIKGQESAKRALEIAAAGGHHLLMMGSPGAGKSMLAARLPSIPPPLSPSELLEVSMIASVAGEIRDGALTARRPFRSPHHSASMAALTGGGLRAKPGEISLAHHGVLFLDELPEFARSSLESLRPTMESGLAMVARAHERVIWPARPLVIAAMNPCACGYADDPTRLCTCPPDRVERYRARVSGPLLDRFDLHVSLPRVDARSLREATHGEPSAQIRERVIAARTRQRARQQHASAKNAVDQLSELTEPSALALLDRALDKLGLSVRAYVKVLQVARTIADLAESEHIGCAHVAEAVQYRLLDREPDTLRMTTRSALTIG
jgi:magnesium chelatase family protein